MVRNPKDLVAGLVYVVFGATVIWKARDYEFGSVIEMGPSYFPAIVAALLVLVGLIMLGRAVIRPGESIGAIAWRPMLVVTASIVLFGLLLRGAGLVPALAVLLVGSGFAPPKTDWIATALLTLGLIVFCYLVFVAGLGIPLQAFGTWFE